MADFPFFAVIPGAPIGKGRGRAAVVGGMRASIRRSAQRSGSVEQRLFYGACGRMFHSMGL